MSSTPPGKRWPTSRLRITTSSATACPARPARRRRAGASVAPPGCSIRAPATSIDATPSSFACVSARRCSASPRIDAIHVWPPRKRCDAIVAVASRRARPSTPARAPCGSRCRSAARPCRSRAMPLPVHAELRHMPGSSSPDRCTGIAHVGRQKAAVAADAQLGAELLHRRPAACASRSTSRRRAPARRSACATTRSCRCRPSSSLWMPWHSRHVTPECERRSVGGNRRLRRHHAVDHERHVVTAAAVLARRRCRDRGASARR